MSPSVLLRASLCLGLLTPLAGCGGFASGDSGLFGGARDGVITEAEFEQRQRSEAKIAAMDAAQNDGKKRKGTIWDLFKNSDDPNTTVEVNKYLWQASLEVLNFLPIESVDPFTGVIVTGYGVPPGGGRAYRATVYVQDPALDARSLKVSLQSRGGGAVSPETHRAVEDAILTRARQLRVRDSKL
ncbi:DUF3576 domain-containing protein [Rhodobacter sp. Har01]|uniref:DUF3576 domain-containing protein n=1 Tax=Rhodobacter sp. Har01 TaxID=2883999 RepID=UPI001D09903A|nr:DUF3576 domain-containing protein [Rhodobacter sp. Har01]MCB6177781.1 DUF3576 domain-containing protein [Rhodobacter sp. Har01]